MNQRPISTIIFGILNIGLGLLKIGGPLLAAAMAKLNPSGRSSMAALQSDPAYAAMIHFNMWAGVVLGLALLTFGIGLLFLQSWARLGSIVYSMVAIVLVLIGSMIGWPITKRVVEQAASQAHGAPMGMIEGFAMLFFVLGIILGLVYPSLLLFFMTRPNVIEACQPNQPSASV